jgi:hypothetical protein
MTYFTLTLAQNIFARIIVRPEPLGRGRIQMSSGVGAASKRYCSVTTL